jgi:3-hydroxy-3-methylglutaryl CoA synthase
MDTFDNILFHCPFVKVVLKVYARLRLYDYERARLGKIAAQSRDVFDTSSFQDANIAL